MHDWIRELDVVLAWSGFADGPSQALRDHLLHSEVRNLTTIAHPLTLEGPHHHEITRYVGGQSTTRRVRTPVKPPFSYPLDIMIPLGVPRCDLWVGFNSLAVLRGLLHRARRRKTTVVSWHVDFVPERFGQAIATRVYDALDKLACTKSDARVELSSAAREGRDDRHHLDGVRAAPVSIVPMGAWTSSVAVTGEDGYRARRVVFMGHLVRRQGVDILLRSLKLAKDAGQRLEADIIGSGPDFGSLVALAESLGLADDVTFHGFRPDHREVEGILARCSVAAAPYLDDPSSFTRYADPGKLKAYLAAGLPIVVTNVPPNAKDLAAAGAALVVDSSPDAFSRGLLHWLANPKTWATGRQSALLEARRFDWGNLFDEWLSTIDVEVRTC
ncbi:MAG TPA: glycosyltransferase [Acidimicrobiales bacterium]|nr:glycosyltransferase [Acidimicrobiales bacterium]